MHVAGCSPEGGEASVPPLVWDVVGVACGPVGHGEGCAGSSVCVPRAEAPFQGGCIWRSGDHACPTDRPARATMDIATDDRGCTPCACDVPQGATCQGVTTLYSNPSCKDTVATVDNDGDCDDANGASAAMLTIDVPTIAACGASGGEVTGDAKVTDVVTVCCPG